MMRVLRSVLLMGALCLCLAACGKTYPGTQTAAPGASATPTSAASTSTPAPTATLAPGITPTLAQGIQCGTITQNPDGSVANANYPDITKCLTGSFGPCQPAFLEFIQRSADAMRDYTFTVLRKDNICQVYVNDHVQPNTGSETRHFYYCTKATQNGAKAVLTGCDTHYTNGTISIPA
jgi:hypothetical protein